ncbi:MAG: 50S ribosomal protein L32 [Candidatus Vogelbacteria bacterium CG10_big_fil_rev_8_21_14_0_10_45_14]|uniref:Large ribosomal subunit protein bL32 n=1 Tax=Candidatus Vogelbacteria bacterium CG10_big_fil_rev_8_21_14_0_10_45_14 TaxID=1975042 RepID=A0A2H0RJ60_9BACT|nr:MAG: 50S ribosomal protein L32 [Candidatus Vogelbacteria bacterium CG10_big_fil_rev_8_21_14_0_10_45_14]
MSVRMRHTRAHTRNRRSHHALTEATLTSCEKCNAMRLRHTACGNCGVYRGRQVIDMAGVLKKKEERRKRHDKELMGQNAIKREKTKTEPKKSINEEKVSKDSKSRKGFNLFRKTPVSE